MTTLDGGASTLLERIRSARTDQSSVADGGHGIDLASAYRIQAALGDGRLAKGYKLVPFPGDPPTPVYGRLYADLLLAGPVALGSFLRPRFAVRFAVVCSRDLPAGATPGLADAAVAARFLAIEVTDSVWDEQEATLAGVVADNASTGGVVLGERLVQPPLRGDAVLSIDREVLAVQPLDAYDDCGERLCWLAGEIGGVAAGQIVLLGAGDDVPARPGALELSGPDGSVLRVEITS